MSDTRKAGVDRTVIMNLTGHKTLSMFTRYNTLDRADAKDAVEELEGFYAKEGSPSAARRKKGSGQSPNPLKPLAPRAN